MDRVILGRSTWGLGHVRLPPGPPTRRAPLRGAHRSRQEPNGSRQEPGSRREDPKREPAGAGGSRREDPKREGARPRCRAARASALRAPNLSPTLTLTLRRVAGAGREDPNRASRGMSRRGHTLTYFDCERL